MSKFKAGDKVRLAIGGKFSNGSDVCTVNSFVEDERGLIRVWIEETGGWCREHQLVLAYPNPPHEHAELIKAWADGAPIQYYNDCIEEWRDCLENKPVWGKDDTYRIKPTEPTAKEKAEAELKNLEKQVAKLKSTIKDMPDA